MKEKKERRRYLRAEKCLPLKVSAQEKNIVAATKNISANGLYCEMDEYVMPMTKVFVTLLLPSQYRSGKKMRTVEGEGVVVRLGPVSEHENGKSKRWQAAIYFSGFSEKDKEQINRYVNQHLSHKM